MADLPPTQLVLIGVAQHVTVLLAEVPAGVVADALSRRRALIVAHVVMGAGMLMTGLVTSVAWLALAQCLWGLGWAISSGADVAWITDELADADLIDPALVAAGRCDLLGTAAGIIGVGALGWAAGLSVAMVVAGAAMVALGVLVVGRWPESWSPSAPDHPWRQARATLCRGIATARASRVIVLVLIGTLLVNGGAMGYGRLLERRLIGLGLPATPAPVVWFAAIALVAAALGAIGLRWVELRINHGSAATRVYVGACAIGAIGLGTFAVAPNPQSAVAASMFVSGLSLPAVRVASTVLVNRRTTSEARATVHSLLSQSENLGEAICGLVLAVLAASTSISLVLLVSGVLMAAAGLVMADLWGRRASAGGDERAPHRFGGRVGGEERLDA